MSCSIFYNLGFRRQEPICCLGPEAGREEAGRQGDGREEVRLVDFLGLFCDFFVVRVGASGAELDDRAGP